MTTKQMIQFIRKHGNQAYIINVDTGERLPLYEIANRLESMQNSINEIVNLLTPKEDKRRNQNVNIVMAIQQRDMLICVGIVYTNDQKSKSWLLSANGSKN